MSEYVVKARLIADASGLKSGAGEGKAAMDGLKGSTDAANSSARKFGDGLQRMTAEEFKAAGGMAGLEQAFKKADAAAKQTATSIDQVGKASKQAAAAMASAEKASRRTQMGTQQLGLQINDLATQVSMGTPVLRAFSMQAGQIGWAMSQSQGAAGKFGAFLAGPWGAGLLVAGMLVSNFAGKFFGAKKAADDLSEAAKAQSMSIGDLTETISANIAELDKQNRSSRESAKATLEAAAAHRQRALDIRKENVALLEWADTNAGVGLVGNAVRAFARGRIGAANAAAAESQSEMIEARIPILRGNAKAVSDPRARADLDLENATAALTEDYRKASRNAQDQARLDRLYVQGLANLNAAHQKRLDALKEGNRRQGDPSLPRVGAGDVSALLREALGGGTVTRTLSSAAANRRVGGVANSYHLTGQAVDFVPRGGMGSLGQNWREDIRAAAAAVGIKVLELLGPGDRGHSDHLHLAFAKQRLGPDQVAAQASRESERLARLNEQRRREADQLATFGTNAGQAIANASGRFGAAPRLADQARATLSELDQLLAEIEKRKPPNFEALLQQGREAKEVVANGIYQPFRDFLEDQKFQIEQQRLIATGREDEAEALTIIYQLQRDMGPLTAQQAESVRAIVSARRAEQREAEIAREKQQIYLNAVSETREAVRGIFDFSGKGLKEFPKRIAATFEKLAGDVLFEKMFGKFFRQIEDQIKGDGPLEVFDKRVDTASGSLGDFTQALKGATTALGGSAAPSQTFMDSMEGFLKTLPGGRGSVTGGENGSEIVITAQKRISKNFFKQLGDGLNGLFKNVGGAMVGMAANVIQQMFGGVGQMGGKVTGGKLSDMLGGIAQTVGQFVPQLGIGMAVTSGLSKILGVKNFAGGAFGIVGNLVASVLGFGKKKSGGQQITGLTGGYNDVGNSGKLARGTIGAADSVRGGLQQIIDQLGGSAGAFNVTIGMRGDDWRVNTGGTSLKKKKGAKDFNQDEAGAIAYAIADAIKDGAITGLSAAVQKALRSSTDIDKALAEATKTQEVELLINGVRGQMEKQFRDFENVAKERVRIARTYGLGLVKLEKINAEERTKVFNDILQSRIGSLKELLNDLNFGDLFEGTPLERMAKLRGELARAAIDAEAGVEGAADRQAQLSRDLVGLSREAYGTAGGEFAADLAAARSGAERTIQLESARVQAAADAARQTNQHLSENNSQNARLIAGQDRANALLETIAARGGIGISGAAYSLDRQPLYMDRR